MRARLPGGVDTVGPRRPPAIVTVDQEIPVDMEPPSAGDELNRDPAGRQPTAPSLLDAIAPIVVLILLIALTIASFGVSATDGPLQVALMLSAAFASLVALKNGYTSAALAEAAIGGVTTRWGRSSSCCQSAR
jgi:hypothetical protein